MADPAFMLHSAVVDFLIVSFCIWFFSIFCGFLLFKFVLVPFIEFADDCFLAIGNSHRQALKPSVLKTFPIIVFRGEISKMGLNVLRLSGVCEGEKARILPKCNHGFHMECIDKWFRSHATCPLCRHRIWGHSDRNPIQESSIMEDELRVSHAGQNPNQESSTMEQELSTMEGGLRISLSNHNPDQESSTMEKEP